MYRIFEKHAGAIVFVITIFVLFWLKNMLCMTKIESSLTDFLNIFSIFAGFLTTSISILYSIQDKDFIITAKTSGAYQDLLNLIYKAIGCCVLSIVAVIIAKLITVDSVKLIALSICFGALSAVILTGFLFIKLMRLNK
ncbi:MAG: hypothetical protein SO069_07015 [Succinivibrio sp.]|nr:hypothetical protein [Succinivibrio sp.]